MGNYSFDVSGRFVVEDYASLPPFASFLPGIAGPLGIPLWAFYVNRGQAIAGFGVESKDSPIMEYQPANKAYQTTPFTGFRTFIKLERERDSGYYEPFSSAQRSPARTQRMNISANEVELEETAPEEGLEFRVVYFVLPGEDFAALARRVTVKNIAAQTIQAELLDGLPILIPHGVDNQLLKGMSRTAEAWMDVFNRERGIPFYRTRSSLADKPEVETVSAGNFCLTFVEGEQPRLLPVITDPALVFGQNTSLSYPDEFLHHSLDELLRRPQQTAGKTPCGFGAARVKLEPGETLTISSLFGYVRSVDLINSKREQLMHAGYLDGKLREANALTDAIAGAVATQTSSPRLDAYCRQNLIDNVMRGGMPILLGNQQGSKVIHIYSRKHGDLERDYNNFVLPPEFYSQGTGNYRDVAQNRRDDVRLNPRVGDYNIRTFMNLIQIDGYNPLVVHASRFSVRASKRNALANLADQPDKLAEILSKELTPGQLLQSISDQQLELKIPSDEFVSRVVSQAEQHSDASFGEGYWIDHWTYNLDLIESYLAIFPDGKDELLFQNPIYTFYDSPALVQPRAEKYVLVDGQPRQLGAVVVDEEKVRLIAARTESTHLMRTANGRGEVYRVTLFAKLVCLAAVKFATLDPCGMGIEMEADKPGWYDALNGLPGIFGSSMPETYELARLLEFLLQLIRDNSDSSVQLPAEVYDLLMHTAQQVETHSASSSPARDFEYWDAVAGEREIFRDRTRLGVDGNSHSLRLGELARVLELFDAKVQAGIARALELSGGIPPTYFSHSQQDRAIIADAEGNPELGAKGRSFIQARQYSPIALPLFLEGPTRWLQIQSNPAAARRVYDEVRTSELFDRKLKMYKVNASLESQPYAIGRARAFTPGWLENESIWMHMEFKYLLQVLRAGLYDEFFADLQNVLPPFLDPAVYGRSPLENSSFIVSSAHPDESLHGRGFVARLSGSTAEFLSIWHEMMAGHQPFVIRDGELCLALKPILPGWLFDDEASVTCKFLGYSTITYYNPTRRNTFGNDAALPRRITLELDGESVSIDGSIIRAPYAAEVRAGKIKAIRVFLDRSQT